MFRKKHHSQKCIFKLVNMKNSSILMCVLAACLSMPLVFTSCGSDNFSEEEETPVVPTANTTRIELSFSGDYAKYSPSVGFSAIGYNGSTVTLHTSDSTDVQGMWQKFYSDGEFSTVSASINGSYHSFDASIFLLNINNDFTPNSNGTVVIYGTDYKDGRVYRKDSVTVTFTAATQYATLTYSEDKGFTRNDE